MDRIGNAVIPCPPRYLHFTVPPELEGVPLWRLLKSQFHMAEGFIAALKQRPDGILLNGQRAFTNRRVGAGDRLTVRVDDGEKRSGAAPAPLPLSIPYEDEDLAVIEKPAGIAVHGIPGGPPTLANAMAACWGPRPFHPVHRLDRGTSGLLVVAKSAYAAELLRRSIHTEDFVREYLALVHGTPEPPAGVICLPLGKAAYDSHQRCTAVEGQAAATGYRVLAHFPGGSLLRLRLYTGRTHQIRVHLSALGHPLFGDLLYGAPAEDPVARPALHSAFLRLRQPVTGETLVLASPLPEELRAVLLQRKIPMANREFTPVDCARTCE